MTHTSQDNLVTASSSPNAPTKIRYRVVAWLTLAAALAYLCRNSISVAESQIRSDLGLSIRTSGWMMAAFFWSYALLQVPAGSFSHKYGVRIALSLFAFSWSVAMFATAISPGLWLLIIAQLVMGIAQAGIFPASTASVNHWMPMSQRSFGCGMLAVGMQVGAIGAAVLTGAFIGELGWRWTFALLSVPGIVWAILFLIQFRDRPELSSKTNIEECRLIASGRPPEQTETEADDAGPTDWGAMFRHFGIWMIYGQQMCRSAAYIFFASWFPTFLQKTRGVSIEHSGYMQGIVFAGALAGGFLGGIVTDWIWKKTGNLWLSRSGVGSFSLGASGILILASWGVESATIAMALIATGVLFATFAGPAMFAAVIDISGTRVPQVLGAVNMTGNLAVAVCPIIVGEIFERTANWNLVLVLFALLYLTGAVFWLFVDPRKGIFHHTETPPEQPLASN
ncbi:MFS transporter [Planctomicrobium sp. SH661]|uniref:MFS transporter n=1 Tax=Planctomicrobium sp. SH661 TaxID=3448124 RepID=UPI003F5BB2E8